jgi:uncharacterized protein
VKLQQKVMVTVMEVDVARKRISLSMKGNAPADRPGRGHTDKKKAAENDSPRPDPFQAKLMELKNKFKDR